MADFDMTPEQQKLIDAAAEQQYEEDRKRHVNTRSTWPKWKDAPDDVKNPYRSAVTIPVTVALRAAEQLIRENTIVIYGGQNYYLQKRTDGDRASLEYATAISSLIPQETQNG